METKQALIIQGVMADAVHDASIRLFCDECKIDHTVYKIEFPDDFVFIQAPNVRAATQLFHSRGRLIARKCWEWVRSKAEIWSGTPKPISIFASQKGKLIGDNMKKTGLEIPRFPWIGGKLELTQNLYDAMGEMLNADKPMGLVTASSPAIQLWVNPKAVELFKLTSLEEAVERNTDRDWYAPDLEVKRQMIRDAGEKPFEITYRTQVGDGTWKQLTNRYRLVDSLYLVGSSLASEIIEAPELISV